MDPSCVMTFITKVHQRFHVPIMEELSPKAYVRENPFAKKTLVQYLHFGYVKLLVILGQHVMILNMIPNEEV